MTDSAVEQRSTKLFSIAALQKAVAFVVLVALLAYFGFAAENFFTEDNLVGILQATAVSGVLGVACTFTIITGGIDLSVGTLMTFCAVMCGVVLTNLGMPLPFGVVTVTSTLPLPAGEVAVIEVSLLLNFIPGDQADPKLTAVAPVKPLPVMVTAVPPAAGPLLGVMLVTTGADGERIGGSMYCLSFHWAYSVTLAAPMEKVAPGW